MKVHSIHQILRRKLQLWILPASLLLGLFSVNVSYAQTNAYFDPSGTNNAGEGGSGTWSTSQTIWTTNSVNATANSGGPTGGGLFAAANAAASGTALTNSGNYIFNFGGTAGTVNQGGSYLAYGVNFLTTGYIWNIDGTGTNARSITTTNGVNLGANVGLTLASGPRGVNSYTFTGPTAATAVGITGTNGSTLTLRNLTADTASNSFGVYLSGGTISSNIAIDVDIGTGARIAFGSQSSSGATINSAITLNTNASGVALNITNSSSGIVALNGVISGSSGLVLNNSSSGKIQLTASNTYSGGTTLNNTGTGLITISNAAAFGTGTITSAGSGVVNYVRAEASGLDITNRWQIDSGSTLRLNANTSGWNVTASGVIAGAGSMMFSNSGINYYLTGINNSFGGGVTVGNGTLYYSKMGMAGENSSLGTNGTITIAGPLATTTGGLRWIGTTNEISDKTIVVAGTTGGLNLYANGATNASLTLSGNINSTGAGAKTLNFAGYNTNTLTLNGVINENGGANSVVIGASSSGTVVLGNNNNSFSGAITVTNSTSGQSTYLSTANIGNAGQNSALGMNGTINIGSGSSGALTGLKYTGTGETSDKVINLAGTTGGAILDQSGTGDLKFTSTMTATGVGAKAITLQGSTIGTGELVGNISDLGGNVVSLNKYGTGNWTLSGNNSYTGNTTIRDTGVLKVTSIGSLSQNSSLLGSSSISSIGTLDLKAGGDYVAKSFGTSGTGGFNMNFTNSSGSAATLRFTNAENYVTVSSSASGGRTLLNQSSNLDVKFDGNIEIGSTSNDVVAFGGAGNFRVDGAIKNSAATGTRGLEKTGNGTLTLAGSGNNYNGSTSVKGGTLEVGVSGALPTNTSVSVSSGAKLKFNQSSGGITVGAMTVAGTLEQKLLTITSSGNVNLDGATLNVTGDTSSTVNEYILISAASGSSVSGTLSASNIPSGYVLSINPNSVKLVKTVVPTGPTFDTTYPPGSEKTVGPNGLQNLMNYALGGAGSSSSPALPVLSSDANGLTLTANIRNDDTTLRVVGQYAYSLESDWHDFALTPSPIPNAPSSTLTTMSFTPPGQQNQPRMFLRLSVTK